MSNRTDNLQAFAKRIEARMLKGKSPVAMEQLICRLLSSKDHRIASAMASKWTEWRYGRVPETPSITINNQPIMVMSGYTNDRIKALKRGTLELASQNCIENELETKSIEANDSSATNVIDSETTHVVGVKQGETEGLVR